MTCGDMEEMLVAFTGDELAPAQREFVELHLEHCGSCRANVADLNLTRRQLEGLREDGYQPRLADRITRSIGRRQFRTTAGLWLGRGARFVGGVAAALLVGVALGALLQGRLPFGRDRGPASPGAASATYLLADRALLRVDAGSGTARPVAEVDPQAEMAQGGGRRFLLNYGFLTEVLPTGELRNLRLVQDSHHLWASPDGKVVWLLRQESQEHFALDMFDTETGRLTADLAPKPGNILSGTISRDGQRLYLIGEWLGVNYLKVVDVQSRKVLKAHALPDAATPATALVTPRGDRVYAAGNGWLAVVNPEQDLPAEVLQAPGLTPHAVLTPDGRRVIAAMSGGGLLVIDPRTGKELQRVPGTAEYARLFWSADGRELYGETGGALEVRSQGRLALVGSPIPLGP